MNELGQIQREKQRLPVTGKALGLNIKAVARGIFKRSDRARHRRELEQIKNIVNGRKS
ncbi:hypothetical protein [Georhizobium profundi]|uniref:hypothetical protein n=1 Tax=Georhizobium profundi TaxID=2341112 RepID=UPI0013DFAFAE|nr:hypothetical protein [Georhizobium profundi]